MKDYTVIHYTDAEPWISPRLNKAFAYTKEERAWGEACLEAAPDAPAATVPVKGIDGRLIREEEIGGALSFHAKDIVCVEADLEQADSNAEWRRIVGASLKEIRTWLSMEYRLAPVNPGRHKLVLTSKGMMARVFFIFVRNLFDPNKKDRNAGRYGPLLQHLKPGVSKEIGSGLTVGLGYDGEPTPWRTNAYADWDSFYFIRKESLSVPVDAPIVKVYGTEDLPNLAKKCAAGNPDPVFKGVGLVVPEAFWANVCYHAGIVQDPDTLDMIAANRDHVKFKDDREVVEGVTLYYVLPHIRGKKVRLTSDERQIGSLREEMIPVLAETRRVAAEEIADAYSAYAEGDSSALVSMVARAIDDMAGLTEDEVSCLSEEEREHLNALFNNSGRVRIALAAGLPVPPAEVLSLVELLLEARIKGITVPGIAAFSMPSNRIGSFGCALNAGDCYRLGIRKGDEVTDIRYPNTGSGMLSLEVKAYHYLPAVAADPRTGAAYQAEDYDGDISFTIPVALVHNDRIVINATKNTDCSDLGDPSLASVFCSASFGKLNIGMTDSAITRMLVAGFDRSYLTPVYERLQALIDMAKKNVSVDESINTLLRDLGVPQIPSTIRLQKGRLATSALTHCGIAPKRSISLTYPVHVLNAWHERTEMDVLFKQCVRELPLLIPESHGKYVELRKAVLSSFDEKTPEQRAFDAYNSALRLSGNADLVECHISKLFERRDFDEAYAEANEDMILENLKRLAVSRRVAKVAFRIHELYQDHIKALGAFREDAYDILHKLKDNIVTGDQDLRGEAMQFLFWAIAGRNSKKVYGYVQELARELGRTPIYVKSAAILASLPTMVGKYNLTDMVRRSGYRRTPGIRVVRYHELRA